MIVTDTSALAAVLLAEPDAAIYRTAIDGADRCVLSAVSLLEIGLVLRTRQGSGAMVLLDNYLTRVAIEIAAFDHLQAKVAIAAFDRYGKGIHSTARLNFGDCAAYALAKCLNAPLLFKGNDFAATDITSALATP